MQQIIGIRENKGTYEGKPYTNYTIFVQVENSPESKGVIVSQYKIPLKVMQDLCNTMGVTFFDLVGYQVDEIYYNAYKQVAKLNLSL